MSVTTKPATQNKTLQKPAHFVALEWRASDSWPTSEKPILVQQTQVGVGIRAQKFLKNLIYCPRAALPLSVRSHSSSALIAVM